MKRPFRICMPALVPLLFFCSWINPDQKTIKSFAIPLCRIEKPDTLVFNIFLNDPVSPVKQLGRRIRLRPAAIPFVNYRTSNSLATLTLYYHPGNPKNSFSEFQVKINSPSDSSRPTRAGDFITGNGIQLLMTKNAVVTIMGTCWRMISRGKESEVIRYESTDAGSPGFLYRNNARSYYAEYEFLHNQLIRFRCGFQ